MCTIGFEGDSKLKLVAEREEGGGYAIRGPDRKCQQGRVTVRWRKNENKEER